MRCIAITQNSGRKGQFGQELRDGHRCKRSCAGDSDFCKQHNPLNTLEDQTCAICLDDIKNPMKMESCSHVFCKECLTESVVHASVNCPCCREGMSSKFIATCIKHKVGKYAADKFLLTVDMVLRPELWTATHLWTEDMMRRFTAVYHA